MPITTLLCPCNESPQPLDHYDGACPLGPSEKNWYRWLLKHELDDTRHADGKLSPTRLLTCPREVLLQDFTGYTFNVLFASSRGAGTKFHEVSSGSPLLLMGNLFGLEIVGELDNNERMASGYWWIDDTKMHSDYRWSKMRADGRFEEPSDDLVFQLNVYRHLFDKSEMGRVGRLTSSHFSMFHGFQRVEIPFRDEDWLAQVRPLGNPFTVAQIAGFYHNALEYIDSERILVKRNKHILPGWEGEPRMKEAIASTCPRVGREMLKQKGGNSWKCDHCMVREVCDGLD